MARASATKTDAGIMDRRALNRALLARQFLLERAALPAERVIAHIAGMQAQSPTAPYAGLWSRVAGFRPEDLGTLLLERRVVRAPLMRATIHLVTAEDALAWRPVVAPVMERGFAATSFGKNLAGIDRAALAAAGWEILADGQRSRADLAPLLASRWPDRDPDSLAMAISYLLPVVQQPPRGVWGAGGQATWVTMADWLGRSPAEDPAPDGLVLRYLAAFGPATPADAQQWSGLTGLRAAFERLRPGLATFRDERGREVFDLPDAPRPDPETPAPPRFLAEFDNALLSHADRTRILADAHKASVFTVNGIVKGTILVDGHVAGVWRIERERGAAALRIEPFAHLPADTRAALEEEGTHLLDFAAADAPARAVRLP